ncbi:hypothetical protein CEB3_c24750 [Peptococcaceae bacterium CEB3]|nr:hypothetical protein CEB3_c24750 [Peptococcaceae bacterium CEB3]
MRKSDRVRGWIGRIGKSTAGSEAVKEKSEKENLGRRTWEGEAVDGKLRSIMEKEVEPYE